MANPLIEIPHLTETPLNLPCINATLKIFWCNRGVNIARSALDALSEGGAQLQGIMGVWGADAAQPSVTVTKNTGANRSAEHIQPAAD